MSQFEKVHCSAAGISAEDYLQMKMKVSSTDARSVVTGMVAVKRLQQTFPNCQFGYGQNGKYVHNQLSLRGRPRYGIYATKSPQHQRIWLV